MENPVHRLQNVSWILCSTRIKTVFVKLYYDCSTLILLSLGCRYFQSFPSCMYKDIVFKLYWASHSLIQGNLTHVTNLKASVVNTWVETYWCANFTILVLCIHLSMYSKQLNLRLEAGYCSTNTKPLNKPQS